MSINVSSVAKMLTSKLMSMDKSGYKNAIGSDTWNTFFTHGEKCKNSTGCKKEHKGNPIINFIVKRNAEIAIQKYLEAASRSTGENVNDIGQKWLTQLEPKSYRMAEERKDESIVKTTCYPKTVDESAVTAAAAQKTLQQQAVVSSGNAAVITQPVTSKSHQDGSYAVSKTVGQTAKPSMQFGTVTNTANNTGSKATSVPVMNVPQPDTLAASTSADKTTQTVETPFLTQPVRVAVTTTTTPAALEPKVTDNERVIESGSENAEDKILYRQKINDLVNSVMQKWKKNSPAAMALLPKMTEALSQIDKNSMSQAQVISVLRQSMFAEIKRQFNGNVKNTARFIKDVADTLTDAIRDKNKVPTREEIVTTAMAYANAKISSRTEGNQYFSEGKNQKWCCDTATTIVFQVLNDALPNDFDTSLVANLKDAGNRHTCYKETSKMKSYDRQRYIAENVKPGDFMIERRGKSHTGVVIEVAKDGSWFKTVEGNVAKGTTVAVRTYSCDSRTLSGFISLDKYIGEGNLQASA